MSEHKHQQPARPKRFATLAIHAGQHSDPTTGAVIPPIYQTSTYAQEEVGKHKGYEYSRTGNPTRAALEDCLAALEGVNAPSPAYGLAFASGMAAIDTVLKLLKPGDHVLVGDDVYGGTYRLFENVYRPYGIDFTYVDMSLLEDVDSALQPNTRLVWLETPTNPLLKIADIAEISHLAKGKNPATMIGVDNTFASPYVQQPLALGADISLHSTTKYLGGHSDVVGGAVISTSKPAYERMKYLQNAVGAVPGPMDCFLTLRGIKTLALRMDRHAENAARIAQFLAEHPAVESVIYPGLPDHPGHQVAQRQMCASGTPNYGGMVSFLHQGGEESAYRMVSRTRVFTLAESLGGVESLIEHPGAMTHASVANSPLKVKKNLVRLSVGLEHIDDLLEDLDEALK